MNLIHRVANRWFRAKAIPVDKSMIQRVTDTLYKKLIQKLKNYRQDEPLGDRKHGLIDPVPVPVKLLSGEMVYPMVEIQSRKRPEQTHWFHVTHNVVTGGAYQVGVDPQTEKVVSRKISIYLNGTYTPRQIFEKFTGNDDASLKFNFRRVLLHEWTHTVDPFVGKPGPKKKYDYQDSPKEVRARIQEVADQVLSYAR